MTWNSKSVPITTIISDILSCTCDDSLVTKKLVKSLLGNAKWVWPSDLSTKVVEYIGKWICYNISDLFLILLQVRCFQLSYCLDLKCGILNTNLYIYFWFQRLHTLYTAMGWKSTRPNCIFNFGCTIHFGILAYCLGIYCHKCCYRLPLWITNGNTGYIHICNFRHYFCTLYDQNIPCKTCRKVGWFYT